MGKPKALLLENIHPDAAAALARAGFSVSSRPGAASEGELRRLLGGVALLGVRSRTRVTRASLARAKDLLAVGAFCVGTGNVDLGAAADLVRGKRLGIIGYGNIGGQAGLLAEALGMKVLFYDLVEKLALGNAHRCSSQAELLRQADVVTLHVDERPRNEGLIGEKELRALRRGALLINASRGRVVDLKALARALRRGHLAGAAVDVFPEEPAADGRGFVSPLQGLPNVILTPHVGGSTVEAQRNIAAYVSEKLAGYARMGDTFYSVNLPQVQLPVLRKCHRLLHIHRNVPGVMSQINTILASHGINITGQYLETDDRIGYAITDIARTYDRGVIKSLEGIGETVRLRVLF